MQTAQSNVFVDRDDTFFGVCEALGEDFRFNPQFLRVGFALALFFNPLAAVAAYVAAGALVAITRWAVPNPPAPVEEAEETGETQADADPAVEVDEEMSDLAIAA